MPVDLATLINSIQVAEPGHVITEEYHSDLRSALLQIAQQLSGGVTSSQNVVLSHPPEFTQNDSGPNWSMVNGIASKDASGSANGWFRVQFPQGARILQMIVSGRRAGTTSFPFSVRLVRVNVTDGESLPVIALNLGGASDPFSV